MSVHTPRVDACIEAVSKRFPSLKSTAYFEEIHQHITPLARDLERENEELRAAIAGDDPEHGEPFMYKVPGDYDWHVGFAPLPDGAIRVRQLFTAEELAAAPVPQQAAGDARQRQVLHDLAIAAVERWVAAEFKNAKNLGAGGPSERNDMERAARRAIAALADSIPSEGEQQ